LASARNWQAMILVFIARLYGGEDKFHLVLRGPEPQDAGEIYISREDAALSMHILEERYENENAMLKAISEGNTKQALQCLGHFRGYQGERRTKDLLRDRRNGLVVLNSLARKAVESNFVHPAHIHAVSDDFARRIEAASVAELTRISETMICRYCTLVEKFSLRRYSRLIRNAINFVDFNLKEPLSLNYLAEQCNVNASYLSAQFKKEKGITLTDYITARRMEHAASLLHSSDLYIQEIASQCGFLDVNYFTRLFKQQSGMSPREYRKRVNIR
jgi:YesN/AraC family two-component response regulator